MKPKTDLEVANELDAFARELQNQTTDGERIAEINNVRGFLAPIFCLRATKEKAQYLITKTSRRLIYLMQNPDSAGKHSLNPNPINKGVITKT